MFSTRFNFSILLFSGFLSFLHGFPYPDASGFHNVKSLGAKGNGVADDTKYIRQAVSDDRKRHAYFPAGTYLVGSRIKCGVEKFKRRTLHGEGRDKVVIKLKDNCPGFQDTAYPRAVISFEGGFPDQNFHNYVEHLTIDIGKGNPGAVGLVWQTANSGAVYDVTIRSSDSAYAGSIGLGLTAGNNGPAIVRDVSIIGFDIGIKLVSSLHCIIIEKVKLTHQKKTGVFNAGGLPLILHQVTTASKATAVKGGGYLGILNCAFDGLGSHHPVFDYTSQLYLNGVSTLNYSGPVIVNAQDSTDVDPAYFQSDEAENLLTNATAMLNLPIADPPGPPYEPVDEWLKADDFARRPGWGNDYTLQRAIDAGFKNVYVNSNHAIRQPVHFRGSMQRLVGIGYTGSGYFQYDLPGDDFAFIVDDGASETVIFERHEKGGRILHNSRRTLYIKDCGVDHYENTVPGGKVFIQNVIGGTFRFHRQQVWMRQIDPEGFNDVKILNDGGTLHVLGIKTENPGVVIKTINGGRTEVVGAMIYPSDELPQWQPCFLSIDAHVSYAMVANRNYVGKGYMYVPYVREIRGDAVEELFLFTAFYAGYGESLPILNPIGSGMLSVPASTGDKNRYVFDMRGRRVVPVPGRAVNRRVKHVLPGGVYVNSTGSAEGSGAATEKVNLR
ncbi:MAG: hypothetical protein GF398_13720 [Chitinivibrionales bacterium]|nr:hypothetical protein [Chitinivibrionales bacterium]